MRTRKLAIIIAVVAIAMSVMSTASASNGKGPGSDCPPGSVNDTTAHVGGWELTSQSEFVDYLETIGAPTREIAEEFAAATYAFCDKNEDDYACVKKSSLPGSGNGSGIAWLALDNHHPSG